MAWLRIPLISVSFVCVIVGCGLQDHDLASFGRGGLRGDGGLPTPSPTATPPATPTPSPSPLPPLSQSCADLIASNRTMFLTDAQQAMAPAGTYNIPTIGDCVQSLTGVEIYGYYCMLCHGNFQTTNIDARTRTRIVSFISQAEGGARNFPPGSLIGREPALTRLVDAIISLP